MSSLFLNIFTATLRPLYLARYTCPKVPFPALSSMETLSMSTRYSPWTNFVKTSASMAFSLASTGFTEMRSHRTSAGTPNTPPWAFLYSSSSSSFVLVPEPAIPDRATSPGSSTHARGLFAGGSRRAVQLASVLAGVPDAISAKVLVFQK